MNARETIGATCELCGAVIEIDSIWDTTEIRRHFAAAHNAIALHLRRES